jgi:rhodanese-related sulfurtransferase
VALRLRKLGFTNVHPLEGGFDEWLASGYPVDSI